MNSRKHGRDRRLICAALAAVPLLFVVQAAAGGPPPPNSYGGLQNALNRLNDRARAQGLLGLWWLDPAVALLIAAAAVQGGVEAWQRRGCENCS